MPTKRIDFKSLRHAVQFEDVLNYLDIPFKRMGNGQLRSACPICESESDRCLVVTPKLALWHCFSHHKGGDAIALVAETKQLTTRQAAQLLADTFGSPP